MKSFQKFADYYDTIYSKEKNYKKETRFLMKVIKKYSPIEVENILSLGCGTAAHEVILAKQGFKITGIDRSKEMLKIAKEKAEGEGLDIAFKLADIEKFKINKKFDFAMAMYNVIDYLIKNESLEKALKNTAKSLKKGAIFVFDCRYGPAVLKSRPVDKTKKISEGIIRKTKQKLEIEGEFIDINFEFLEKRNKNWKTIAKENHKMRFWYLQELKYFLDKNGFKLIKVCNPMNLNSKISENNWNIFIISQKIL